MGQSNSETVRGDLVAEGGRLGLWWPYLGDGAIILALSLWVGHPYLWADGSRISNLFPDGFTDPFLNMGIALTNLELLRQGVIPLGTAWFPSTWAGIPGAIGVFGLPSLAIALIMALTPLVGIYAAYNLATFVNIPLAAATAYYLGRVVTGSRGAALIAAVTYAFAPQAHAFLFTTIAQIDVSMSYAWLPLMIAFWERLLRQPTRRHVVLASLGTILVSLSYAQTSVYAAVFVGLRLVFQLAYLLFSRQDRVAAMVRLLGAAVASGTLALAVLVPIYLPALLFRPISRSYGDICCAAQGFTLRSFGEVAAAGAVVALAVCGYRLLRRRLALAELALLSLLPITAYFVMLAQGPWAPLPVLKLSLDYIPFMETIRATGRALVPALLGVSLATGYGLGFLGEAIGARLPRRGRPVVVGLAWVAAALVIGQYWLMVQTGRAWPVQPYEYFFKKTLDLHLPAIERVSRDPEPARVFTLPAFRASSIVGAVAKPDLTSAGPSDRIPNRSLFASKEALVRSFETQAPNLGEQAARFGVKYVLLNTTGPTQWDQGLGGVNGGWGVFEVDFADKKEGQASMRAEWRASAAGWAAIAYYLSGAQDWSGAEQLSLWMKFSQGDWGGYLVGLQDAAGAIAWQRFAYPSADQWQEISLPLPFPRAPERFQWNRVTSVVIWATDPAKSFTPLTIQVDDIRLASKGSLTRVDTATEAMFALADYLKSKPREFRFLGFEEDWFTFENLGFRGMAFELCPPGQPCDPVAIDYQRPDANTIRLGFDLDRKARLLVSETYHQGWVVNDPRVAVGNEGGLLALAVDQPGRYEVTLRYQLYDQFLLWVGLGWGGWVLAAAALLLPWRRLGAGLARRPPS